jgi:hypothetical protein
VPPAQTTAGAPEQTDSQPGSVAAGPVGDGDGSGGGGSGPLLGLGALALAALAGGGWLARRALTRSP